MLETWNRIQPQQRTVVACVSPLPKAVSRKNVLKVLPKFSSHLFSTDVFGVKGMTQAEKTKLQMTPVTTSMNQIHFDPTGSSLILIEGNSSGKRRKGVGYIVTRPVTDLEAWKRNGYKGCPPNLDAWYWRERRPSCIPLTVEKDARSDLPEIDSKKFIVYGDMPLGEFVDYIRFTIEVSRETPIYIFFKNTEPPAGALMAAIDEENKDEDGYLHITYSGEESVYECKLQ